LLIVIAISLLFVQSIL